MSASSFRTSGHDYKEDVMKLFGTDVPFLPQPPGGSPTLPTIQIPDQGVTQTESINPPEPWSHGEGIGMIIPLDSILEEVELEDASTSDDDVPPSPSVSAS